MPTRGKPKQALSLGTREYGPQRSLFKNEARAFETEYYCFLKNMPVNRRTFYLTFIYGLWSLMGMILAIPAAIYLLLPPRLRKEREWVEAGNLSP